MVPVVGVSLDVHFRGFLYFCSALCMGTLNRHDSSGFESRGGGGGGGEAENIQMCM